MSVRAKPVVPTASQFGPAGQPFAYGPAYTGQPFAYGPAYTGHPYGSAYTGEAFGHGYGPVYGPPQTGRFFPSVPFLNMVPQVTNSYNQLAAIAAGHALQNYANHASTPQILKYPAATAGAVAEAAGLLNGTYDFVYSNGGNAGKAGAWLGEKLGYPFTTMREG